MDTKIKTYLLAFAVRLLGDRGMTVDDVQSLLPTLSPAMKDLLDASLTLAIHTFQFILILAAECLFFSLTPKETLLAPFTSALCLASLCVVGALASRALLKVVVAIRRELEDEDQNDLEG